MKSLTFDNGGEFLGHEVATKKLQTATYFCAPYHSLQRGSKENTNGMLRQYLPKKTDFSQVSKKRLTEVVDKLNDRPRKRLGYRTPAEVFMESAQEHWKPAVLHLMVESKS